MREFAVVILSNEPDKLLKCLAALRNVEPELPAERIIAVTGDKVPATGLLAGLCRHFYQSPERFCFAREANRGIREAGDRDVFILGDDVLLVEPGTISKLSDLVEKNGDAILHPAIRGRVSLGKTDGDVHWASQFKPDPSLRYREAQMVPFFAVYLPAKVRQAVGELDERFTDYGSEDDDYCYRARLSGIRVLVIPNLFVFHKEEDRGSHTARWGRERFRPDGGVDHAKFIEKHGSYPPPYVPYPDLWGPGPVEATQNALKCPTIDRTFTPRRKYQVFTVSGSSANYRRFLDSVRRLQPDLIGSGRLRVYASWPASEVPGAESDYTYIPQTIGKPFVITRENNRALSHIWSRGHDAVLVEDDVELASDHPFDVLSVYADTYQGRCLIQPGIIGFRYGNVATIPDTRYRVRVEPKHYPIICVYFPVEIELLVGYYDEGFTSYGGDDNDMSLRCVQAGVQQLCLPWLVVKHHFNSSVYAEKRTQDLRASRSYFRSKWGHDP